MSAVVGIIPAGGSGERLGADRPKAFVVCAGRPLIEWSLEVLGSVCDRVVVAAPEGYDDGPDRVRGRRLALGFRAQCAGGGPGGHGGGGARRGASARDA